MVVHVVNQQLIMLNTFFFFFVAISVLLYESAAAETIECSGVDSGNTYSWTQSPDGTELASMTLAASSDRYTINGRSLRIELSNITGEDGGLYRCMYSDNSVTKELCIEVHGESKIVSQFFVIDHGRGVRVIWEIQVCDGIICHPP